MPIVLFVYKFSCFADILISEQTLVLALLAKQRKLYKFIENC